MASPWKAVLDRVAVVRHTAYAGARGPSLEAELSRVGLSGADFVWTFPSPFTPRFASSFRGGLSPATFNCLIDGFYAAVKESLERGHERLLVCEDDVRFPLDVSVTVRALESLPPGFVTAHLSWMRRGGSSPEEILARPRVGGFWAPATGVFYRDSSAVLFSREGMEWYAGCVEGALSPSGRLYDCDMYFRPPHWPDSGRRTYLSVPLVARQVTGLGRRMSQVSFEPRYAPFLLEGGAAAYGGAS